MIEKRERINNTRKVTDAMRTERPARQVVVKTHAVAFSEYVMVPDQDGFAFRHMAPVGYYCKSLQLFLDNCSGARIQLRVGDDEYVERDVVAGENTFQIERVIPAGTRIRLRFIESTTAMGIWIAWVGEASA
jgi:hypothetical protein